VRREAGTYALVLSVSVNRRIQVGRLGRLEVAPGFYVYVGSARGPGGVAARVGRHGRRRKVLKWHVDFLREVSSLEDVWFSHSPGATEHEWARAVAEIPGATVPLAGFGSSDCRCPTHLFRFEDRPEAADLARALPRGDAFAVESLRTGHSG
jgi:Uri superfamily endonuclease